MAVSYVMVKFGWIVVLLATKEFAFLESVFVCGECVESADTFTLGSLILSLFMRRESLSLSSYVILISISRISAVDGYRSESFVLP